MFLKIEKHRSLYTERLILRAPSFLDVNDVFDFCSDPASSKYADWYPHNNKGETREYIAWLKRRSGEKNYTWVIECREDVSLDAICEQMGRTPDWIEGLILHADGYETEFYKKD